MKNWTFLVYLAGDNDLSTAGEADLAELRRVGSSPEVDLVAQLDSRGERGTRRFHVQPDGVAETVLDLGETDSGDPEPLLDFVSWAAETFPAERYGLVLWNHGGGWEPAEIDRVARSVRAPSFDPREAVERSASPLARGYFRRSIERVLGLASPTERAICSDDGSGHSLDTIELGQVLRRIVETLGRPLDLLGLDACLMCNLEVAYQVRHQARFLVASEEDEPADGWPYERILSRLRREPSLTARELAAAVVDAYVDSYRKRAHERGVTQCALDLARVQELAATLDNLAGALLAELPSAAQALWSAQLRSARFGRNTLWDLGHLAHELEQAAPSALLRQAARDTYEALAPKPGGVVVAEAHCGAKVERCTGITVYLPPPITALSPFYGEIDLARDLRWHAMMGAYHRAALGP